MTSGATERYHARVTQPTVDRIREHLQRRYGVVPPLSDDVVSRARKIFGVPRLASTAAEIAVVCSRIDAADREYERDEGGKFAGGGGSSRETPEARPAGTGVGAAQNHHEIAQAHAERARAVAAGTSPAARASARKAEESAALAKVAASFDDHALAKEHAADAERHSLAAQMKATAHRQAGGRGERETLKVENKPMAEVMAERAKPPPPVLSPEESARTAAVRERMGAADAEHLRATGPAALGPKSGASTARTTEIPVSHLAASPTVAELYQAMVDRRASSTRTPKTSTGSGYRRGDQVLVSGQSATVLHGERRKGDEVLVRLNHENGARLVPIASVSTEIRK